MFQGCVIVSAVVSDENFSGSKCLLVTSWINDSPSSFICFSRDSPKQYKCFLVIK